METKYTVILPDGTQMHCTADLPEDPGYERLARIVHPLLGEGNFMDHVTVLHEGKYTDMFVDESGIRKGLERNEKATAIYRNNWLSSHPDVNPENLNCILGIAVLFHRRVWH
jgi:hypothetical protein